MAMMSRRSGVGLAVVNGQLYAVGGFDGTTYLKTIEVFDQVGEVIESDCQNGTTSFVRT